MGSQRGRERRPVSAVAGALNALTWIVGVPLVALFTMAGMMTPACVVAALLVASLANAWAADRRARRRDLALAYMADGQIRRTAEIFADALARRAGR
jgi:hypothetical protein